MTVITVCGEMDERELGIVLAHEHLACDISVRSGRPDNRLRDVPLMVAELARYRASGGGAVFEVTPCDLGSDPAALREISLASGVPIVHGISFYQQEDYPDWVQAAPADDIARFFVDRIQSGLDGVRSGLIGELGSHSEPEPDFAAYRLHEPEARVFRAAALAQRATGVAISTHASLGRPGHAQLDVLEEAGADLGRVVIGHCDAITHEDERADLDYYLPILARGAHVQFDLIGWKQEWPGSPDDPTRARRLSRLISLGYEQRLLLSTDTCRLSQLHAHGGRGLDYLLRVFVPMLRAEGVSEAALAAMLEENPRRLARVAKRAAA